MKYKYQYGCFDVSLRDRTRLAGINITRVAIRFFRAMKRMFINICPIWKVLCIGILFAAITDVIGEIIGKYSSWRDSFWDMRAFFLTSVLLACVSFITAGEKKHIDRLKRQKQKYDDTFYYTNELVENIMVLFTIKIKYCPFQTEELHNLFRKDIDKEIRQRELKKFMGPCKAKQYGYFDNTYPNVQAYFLFLLKEFCYVIEDLKQFQGMLVNENERERFRNYCDEILRRIREYTFTIEELKLTQTQKNTLEFIKDLTTPMYCVLAILRRPWRYKIDWRLDSLEREFLRVRGKICGPYSSPLNIWYYEQK